MTIKRDQRRFLSPFLGVGFLLASLVVITATTTNPIKTQIISVLADKEEKKAAQNSAKNEKSRAEKFADKKINQLERSTGCKGAYCLAGDIIANRNNPANQTGKALEILNTVNSALGNDPTAIKTLEVNNPNMASAVKAQLAAEGAKPAPVAVAKPPQTVTQPVVPITQPIPAVPITQPQVPTQPLPNTVPVKPPAVVVNPPPVAPAPAPVAPAPIVPKGQPSTIENFPVFLQYGTDSTQSINNFGVSENLKINNYGGTLLKWGCGPSTAYNILKLSGSNVTFKQVLDSYLWTGVGSSGDSVLLDLKRNGFPSTTVNYGTSNRMTDAYQLNSYDGTLVYEGQVGKIDHIAAFDCKKGSCYSIDSYFSKGKPIKCDVEGSDSVNCGGVKYQVGPSKGTPGAFYPVQKP